MNDDAVVWGVGTYDIVQDYAYLSESKQMVQIM